MFDDRGFEREWVYYKTEGQAGVLPLLRGKALQSLGYALIILMLPWAYFYQLLVRTRPRRSGDALPLSYVVILWLGLVLTLEFDALLLWSAGRFVWSFL